jgi:hypothetical protein
MEFRCGLKAGTTTLTKTTDFDVPVFIKIVACGKVVVCGKVFVKVCVVVLVCVVVTFGGGVKNAVAGPPTLAANVAELIAASTRHVVAAARDQVDD